MRIIGVVPGAKLFSSEDLYADQYLFVNGYPKRISVCGGTLIGMHLRRVAIPVRLSIKKIGEANILCARTRPKYIGGARAVYQEL